MLIGNKVEVPDECGSFCPYYKQPADMSSPCFRCPIFNCRTLPNDTKGYTPLVKPENFNHSIAEDYLNWWKE